jgi:hypothetical protein
MRRIPRHVWLDRRHDVQALAAGRLQPAVVPFGREDLAQTKRRLNDKVQSTPPPGSRSNCSSAAAESFVPASDDEVLERLAVSPSDPALRELRAVQGQLRQAPDNLALAMGVSQGYLELGRVTGDPHYAGYSEAALTPWWHLDNPPSEVLVLRATLRQRMHQFDDALADLASVLNSNPRNV